MSASTDQIVVGYDGDDSGRDAISFAVRWCRASGDRLLVANVHPTPPAAGISRVDAEWAAYERHAADALLDEAQALVPDGIEAEYARMDSTSAAHALHDLGDDGGAMLVLGTRRRHNLLRTMPGSTATRLFQGSGSTVTIVPAGYAAHPATPLRSVSVAYVDTPDGHVALDHAGRIAAHLGASLTVLAVVPDTEVAPAMGEPTVFAVEEAHDFEAALAAAVARVPAGVPATGRLLQGPVAEALTELRLEDTDLLVCGSRGYGPVRRVFLGGVSHHVVRHSRVPVAVVPRGES